MLFLSKIRLFIDKYSKQLLWLLIIAYGLFFGYLSLLKLDYFIYNNFDLSIFNQVFYNTLNGNWLEMTINLHTYLADHFTPIIFLLLPIYALKIGPENLLIIQSFSLALAAWPLYLITHKVSRNNLLALSVAIFWLLNPFVHYANIYEFHLLTLAPFFFFWCFYFYQENKFKPFIVLFAIALLIREDVSLFLLGFSILAFLDKKDWRWKYLVPIISLIYFFVALRIIDYFSPDGAYKFLAYYGWLGGSDVLSIAWSFVSHPIRVLLHVFSWQNISSALIVLWPFLFLPLLKSKYLLLSLVSFSATLLTATSFASIIFYTHYSLFILPSIFICFIFSLHSLKFSKHKSFIYLLLATTVIYLAIFLSPIKSLLTYPFDKQGLDYRQEVLEQIGDQATIAASTSFLPDLSSRETVYPVSYSYFGGGQFLIEDFDLPLVDYILIDYKNFFVDMAATNATFFSTERKVMMNSRWGDKLQKYSLIWAKNDILLFQNKEQVAEGLFLTEVLSEQEEQFKDNYNLIFDSYFDNQNNILELKLNSNLLSDKHLIRFYRDDYYFDLPLAYSLFSAESDVIDKTIMVKYYLSSDVKSYQVFTWQAENILGLVGEALSDFKLQSIIDQTSL